MLFPGKHSQESEVLAALQEKAEVQGYLTSDDLLEITHGGSAENEALIELVRALRTRGIKFLIQEEPDQPAEADLLSDEQEVTSDLEHISADDSVSLYLKEMALIPLLSLEEEINLAQRIERAAQARLELAQLDGRANSLRRQELEVQIRDGFLARDYLIRANTRLVVSVARKYVGHGVPFLDLIQEGNLGLIRAVEKFEYRRGFRFSTYATWWIRQGITRAIADLSRTIRMPVHMSDRLRQIYKVSQEMEQALGRSPTEQELAGQLELEDSKVRWLLQVAQPPLSLESPVGDEEDSELGMYVEDETSPGPAQVTQDNMLREQVDEVLSTLSPREARVLRMRFGLGQDRSYTLEEVGQKFGLTRERIRQIEGQALRRLRHPCRARLLREYV